MYALKSQSEFFGNGIVYAVEVGGKVMSEDDFPSANAARTAINAADVLYVETDFGNHMQMSQRDFSDHFSVRWKQSYRDWTSKRDALIRQRNPHGIEALKGVVVTDAPVTQDDRDEAEALYIELHDEAGWKSESEEYRLRNRIGMSFEDDPALVQAFARYREKIIKGVADWLSAGSYTKVGKGDVTWEDQIELIVSDLLNRRASDF